jgi:hypothetical protein
VVSAILSPAFLGFAAFIVSVLFLEFHPLGIDLLVPTGVSTVLGAVFGWFYFDGLNQGLKATPPVFHMRQRLAFAVVLTVAAGWVVFGVVDAGAGCLSKARLWGCGLLATSFVLGSGAAWVRVAQVYRSKARARGPG